MQYQLPKDLTCRQCVFQWRYVAGNNWGKHNGWVVCRIIGVRRMGGGLNSYVSPPTLGVVPTNGFVASGDCIFGNDPLLDFPIFFSFVLSNRGNGRGHEFRMQFALVNSSASYTKMHPEWEIEILHSNNSFPDQSSEIWLPWFHLGFHLSMSVRRLSPPKRNSLEKKTFFKNSLEHFIEREHAMS